MEAFSLLKYWKDTRNGGGGSGGGNRAANAKLSSTSIVSTVNTALNDDVSDGSDDDDDGPFFDLEFAALPADADADVEEQERQKVEERESEDETDDEEDEDEDEEIDDLEEVERNMSFSPSDDLFFKGKVIQIDGSDSAPLREMEEIINAAESGNQMPLSAALVKSATKLRVFMLGLKRSKSESKQILSHEIIHSGKSSKNRFTTVRLKMEEVKVPLISLLTRAPSNTAKNTQSDEQSVTEDGNSGNNNSNNEEKRNRKEVVQRYLKLVRPLYVKVSKKNDCEKADEGKEKGEGEAVAATATMKNAKARLNLKVIARKHLGKSKSAAVHTMSSFNGVNTTSSKKSDDSLLQQQDGIQSAILHCKRSFNSSSSSSEDGDEAMSVLMRSASEPSQEKATMPAGATVEEGRE